MKKITKYLPVFGFIILFALSFIGAPPPISQVLLIGNQKNVYQIINSDFHSGIANLQKIEIGKDWDEICVASQHSFSPYDKEQRDEIQFFGDGGLRSDTSKIILGPNPSSMFFGLGFFFKSEGRLVDVIALPSRLRISSPSHVVGGVEYNTIALSDLNLSTKEPGISCYPRSSAFLKFNSYQDISIGD